VTDPLALRAKVLDATYTCVTRFGLAKTSVEDVVRESGVSRATIYRYFPGGREELVRETVGREIGRYFGQLAEAIRDEPDLEDLLEHGLVHARRTLREHAVLQKMLVTEPERLLMLLTTEAQKTLPFIADFLLPYLRREQARGRLRAGLDVERAADYLARGVLSLIGSPGRFDLDDPGRARDVVRHELLGGILDPSAA
jgi:AcrR family transcriptional regulator